jgi:N-acetylmuramoyl-L-alanine amidase
LKIMFGRAAIGLMAIVVTACAPLPQRPGIPTHWQPSPNFDQRRPAFVIIHYTSDARASQALRTLTNPRRGVSAHYLIGRDGAIYQLVDERARAWHAGESWWGGNSDLNSSSLGIELDNNGAEPFSDRQITALLALLTDIERRYRIPAANYLGHSDVAPKRKVDPGAHFPWKTLAASGFGLWCDAVPAEVAAPIDARLGLQAFGYDVSDPVAAIRAFKSHFVPEDPTPTLTDYDRSVLNCLVAQKTARSP